MNIRKFLFTIVSVVVILSCKKATDKKQLVETKLLTIKNIEVVKELLVLNGNQGVWYYKTQPFSGYAVKYYSNNTLKEKVGFYNGKKEGKAQKWFEDGVLKMEYHYHQNKLVSDYRFWWSNGILASEVTYVDGEKEGVEKKWFNTGVLSKKRNLVNGREEGIQHAWLQNGKMYVNYEAKNGRIFGMKRANSCYRLEDELIIRRKKQ
jgi:antitoxin component YwqK of YwqJK toxin-antitoxin module